MMTWGLAALLGVWLTVLLYRGEVPRGAIVLPLLRWVAVTVVVAALLDAPLRRAVAPRPVVALDVSVSWLADDDDAAWRAARAVVDSLLDGHADALRLFGDSLRTAPIPDRPTDVGSRIRPVVEWALATGRPVQVVTDGRLDDPEWVARLPVGSTVHRIDRPARAAAVLTALDAPTAAPAGDTILAEVTVTADAAGAPPRQLTLGRDAQVIARRDLEALGPYETRVVSVPVPLGAVEGAVRLTARLLDGTNVTDSITVPMRITGGAAAVVISTAPDQDARYAVAALRAVRRGPVRAYWQVATGVWRVDGTLAPVEEGVVRREAGEASLLLLHGDTAFLGAPGALRTAGLILMSPPPPGDEFYPVAPSSPSPLSDALSGLPWDSLPPLDVALTRASADEVTVVETRRGRRFESRVAIRAQERDAIGQRVVRIPAAGFWRWRSRGGRSAASYDALVGALVDWAGATPGEAADSIGTTDAAVWAREVARRAEQRPRAPTVASGPVGTGEVMGRSLGARGRWWLVALALAALSLEWMLRRRRGLR
ncbi:MAG: hypothetical protein P2976_04125 [Gemmatimonadota bacterium]|nr:hypothetical protein [Gemmatimonadota bacterium]MDQ8174754.1 hypothetical protein [Gemmatimonadota bacterium]